MPWALLLDAGVIITNFFLVGYLAEELGVLVRAAWLADDDQSARPLGLALLAAFVAQMLGAVLKRAPMQARLAARATAERERAAGKHKVKAWARLRGQPLWERHSKILGALLFLHFVLSVLAVCSIPALLGVTPGGWMLLLSVPFMFIPTLLVWSALAPTKVEKSAPAGPLTHPFAEALANLCLFSYAFINQLFWSGLLIVNSPLRSAGEVPMRAAQTFLFLFPLTAMYFFAPRILFLVEELEDSRTRLSMKLALASIALRWIVGVEVGL